MRVARSTGAVSGALIVLLGLWAGLVPFVGPYFDLSIGTSAAWHYTDSRLWLDILPAVVAILAGLLLILARRRATGALGGWLALIAGAWLILGPTVSLLWERGAGGIGAPLGSAHRQAFELLGYFYGVGVLIIALAAYATGRFV